MDSDVAVRVEGVSKDFHYTSNRASSLKGVFMGIFNQKDDSKDIQHALKDISFEIKKGEFFGIVGRNGGGKSTLLKIIAGIYQPTKGKTSVNGKLVPFIELGVGFNPELTGKENVYLNGALLGFSKKEVDGFYDEVVEFAELEKFMNQKLKNYSSGMQVRLAFSMAIRANADILLVDEVLAVGDADFQRKCYDYFNKLKGSDTTVIFVSHSMTAVREFCDRAVLINESKVVKIGSSEEIANKYLQLFINESKVESSDEGSKSDRWGDSIGTIQKVSVTTNQKTITIKVNLKAKEGLKTPSIGFRMADAQGNYITGTSTEQEGVKTKDMNKGDEMSIAWSMQNVYRDGQYVVDIAVHHADNVSVVDWWNGAARITIKKPHQTPYVVDPVFETVIRPD